MNSQAVKSNAKAKDISCVRNIFPRLSGSLSWLTVGVICVLSLIHSSEVKTAVLSGMRLGATIIVPSVFPFMIFADYYSSHSCPSGIVGEFCKRFFGISPRLGGAFICGNIFGFPTGVKMAEKLYEDGTITKEELEDFIGILNNPSLSFVLCASAFISGRCGKMLLVLSVYLATIVVGILFQKKPVFSHNSSIKTRQRFNLSRSIKDASLASLAICAYISFFYAGLALVKIVIGSEALALILAPLLEVSSAVDLISKCALSVNFKVALSAFALGFSGFCVHMQAFGILPENVSKKRYLWMKLCEGIVAFLLCLLLEFLVNLFQII